MSKKKSAAPATPAALYEERRQRALEMREQGYSLSEIADKLGITPSGVSRIFKRAAEGRAHLPRRANTPVAHLILEILRARNWTQAELAEALGKSVRTVEDWLAGRRNPSEESLRKLQEIGKIMGDQEG